MKIRILLGCLALSLSACSTAAIFQMQSDGTYQINTKKESFAAPDEKETAHARASELCPDGYKEKSGFSNGWRQYTLIVKCNGQARDTAAQ
jgi:ferredoxin